MHISGTTLRLVSVSWYNWAIAYVK